MKTEGATTPMEIDAKYAKVTPHSIEFAEKTPYEVWLSVGRSLKTMSKSVQFWIGDWVNFGEKKYGEKYKEALEITGLSYGALRNFSHTCANVDLSLRNDKLPYAHHEAVAKLSPKEQEKFLKKAEEERMPVSKLRNLIAGRIPEKKLTTCPKCGHKF